MDQPDDESAGAIKRGRFQLLLQLACPGRISIVREGCVPFSKSCGCRAKVHSERIVHQLSVVAAVKSKKIECGGI